MNRDIYILVDNVRSLYNVGSIFRTAEAAGVKKIFLTGISGVEKFGNKVSLHPKLAKTALEGTKVPWEYFEDPRLKLIELKKKGVQIVSLEQTSTSIDYRRADYKFPLCLIVGHERDGVADKITNLSDLVVEIPMKGKGKSLNVSVAFGIALFNIRNLSP